MSKRAPWLFWCEQINGGPLQQIASVCSDPKTKGEFTHPFLKCVSRFPEWQKKKKTPKKTNKIRKKNMKRKEKAKWKQVRVFKKVGSEKERITWIERENETKKSGPVSKFLVIRRWSLKKRLTRFKLVPTRYYETWRRR